MQFQESPPTVSSSHEGLPYRARWGVGGLGGVGKSNHGGTLVGENSTRKYCGPKSEGNSPHVQVKGPVKRN